MSADANFRALLEAAPDAYLALAPDAPRFTIVAVSDAYLRATMTRREDIIGHGLFEVFPNNPADPDATGVRNLRSSLDEVLRTRAAHVMAVQKYDIRRPDGTFEERFWQPLNLPVLDEHQSVLHIIHRVEDVTEKVRSRVEAEHGQRQMTAILESITDAFFAVDLDWRFTYVNGRAEKLLGRSREELLGRVLWEVLPGVSDSVLGRGYRKAIQDRTKVELEEFSPGHEKWFHIHAYPSDAGLAVYFQDVTDRRRLEDVVRLNELRYRAINLASDAIIAIDEAQRIVLFNHGAEAIFGWTAAEAIGQHLDILIPPRLRERHREHVRRFAAGPDQARRIVSRTGALAALHKKGHEFPVDASISKFVSEGTTLQTAILRDISEAVRRENLQRFLAYAGTALSSSLNYEETLSTVAFLAVPLIADWCIIDILDDDGTAHRLKAFQVNPAKAALAQALQESSPHSLWPIHRALENGVAEVEEVIGPEDLSRLATDAASLSVLSAIGPASMIAVPLSNRRRVLGALTFINLVGRPSGDPADIREAVDLARELAHRAALAVDNSRLFSSAQRAIRARDEVLGVVAHDLRNPLNTVRLTAQALSRRLAKSPGQERAVELAATIVRSVDVGNRLIQDLLDVTRIEAGRLVLDRALSSPQKLMEEVLELMAPNAANASIQLIGPGPVTLPEVMMDRDRMLQAFSNLIGNALKFTPAGGLVEFGARHRGNEIEFSVSDTGPGIPQDQLSHLFDRFWQASATDKRGAGLGLAIVKGIVDAHGGRLWVESTAGVGTTFHFSIPVSSHRDEEVSPTPPGG